MHQVVGFRRKSYSFEDGKSVTGYELHLTEKRDNVTGYGVDRIFCSDNKLDGYIPKLGDNISIIWNRYGKCDRVELIKS